MSPSSAQHLAQVFILFGSLVVIAASYFTFYYGNKIEDSKNKEIAQQQMTITALSQDPVLKLTLIENDKFNYFDFKFLNTGISDIEITNINEDYFFNSIYAFGTGGPPEIYKLDGILNKSSSTIFSYNLTNSLYNIEKYAESFDPNFPHIPIVRLKIKYERIIDRKEF